MLMRRILVIFTLAVLALAVGGCRDDEAPTAGAVPTVAVTNTYLEGVARDLLGNTTPIVTLAGPGGCPGHFDIGPAELQNLRDSRILLCFEFQGGLRERLKPLGAAVPRLAVIEDVPGLTLPSTYAQACRQAAAALVEVFPDRADEIADRLDAVERRTEALWNQVRQQAEAAGIGRARLVSSGHQAVFCRALGAAEVLTFSGGDEASAGRIEALLSAADTAAVHAVVANVQEGVHAALALADRLDTPVVVMSNFPDRTAGQSFDILVRANTAKLCDALARTLGETP